MKNATINISPENIICNTVLYSDYPDLFPRAFCTPSEYPTFIGRLARNWDTFLRIAWDRLPDASVTSSTFPPPSFVQPSWYQIESGQITIDVDITEHYFAGQRNNIIINVSEFRGNTPVFGIHGYTIKGSFVAAAKPNDPILQINPEIPNCFFPRQGVVALSVGDIQLKLGDIATQVNAKRIAKAGDITKIEVSFELFANISSTFELNQLDVSACPTDIRNPLF
jgi:hypothetical protein